MSPSRDIDVLAFKSEAIVSLKGIFQEILRLGLADRRMKHL